MKTISQMAGSTITEPWLSEVTICPLFAGLSAAEISEVKAGASFQIFPRGATLLAQGGVARALMVILSGRVKVQYLTVEGREAILGIRGPGDVVGEVSVFDGEPAVASATALEHVEIMSIPADDFRELFLTSRRAAGALMSVLIGQLRSADLERIELMTCDTTARISRRLLELAERWGRPVEGGVEIGLAFSQATLAARAGVSREAAAKSLQLLRDRGVIRTSRRRLRILDLEGLRRRARG